MEDEDYLTAERPHIVGDTFWRALLLSLNEGSLVGSQSWKAFRTLATSCTNVENEWYSSRFTVGPGKLAYLVLPNSLQLFFPRKPHKRKDMKRYEKMRKDAVLKLECGQDSF